MPSTSILKWKPREGPLFLYKEVDMNKMFLVLVLVLCSGCNILERVNVAYTPNDQRIEVTVHVRQGSECESLPQRPVGLHR